MYSTFDNSDKNRLDMMSLPDEALITLLCATEEEIEIHGERTELKQLLQACTMELLRRPALLQQELAPTEDEHRQIA